MDKLGVTVSDLGGSAPVTKVGGTKAKTQPGRKNAAKKPARKSRVSKPVPVRYRDNETGNTWTGRGRPPVWLAERIQQGKTKEDYLIPAAGVAAPDQTPGQAAAS
jgi:DNA-binding protein H-NS